MRHHRTLPILAFWLALMPLSAANAGRPPPPAPSGSTTAATTDRARTLHVEGAKLYEAGKFDQAYAAFAAAWALKKHPQIAGNLADCEMKLGKYRDAAEHFRFVARNVSGEAKPESMARAEKRLVEAQQEIATLKVAVNVEGAEVFFDGVAIGKSPLAEPVFVEPKAAIVVEAKLAGHVSARKEVTATKGSQPEVTLTLAPVAEVRKELPPATVSTRGPNKVIIGAGAGAAGAALISGVVLALLANEKASSAEQLNGELVTNKGAGVCAQPGACDEVLMELQDWTAFKNGAFWSFMAAGALGVATGVYALTAKNTPKVGVRAVPVITTSGGGFMIGGRW